MIDLFLDLLPDETGEYIGFGLMTGATYLYLDHIEGKTTNAKSKVEEMKGKMQELSRTINNNCLSPEALNFIKNQNKGQV